MFDINLIAVVLSVLAVWRVTHLLVAEDGPWDMFAHLRRAAARAHVDRLASCFYCASVWIAVPFALLIARRWEAILVAIPALSGGAIVLERLTASDGDAAAVWVEEKETP